MPCFPLEDTKKILAILLKQLKSANTVAVELIASVFRGLSRVHILNLTMASSALFTSELTLRYPADVVFQLLKVRIAASDVVADVPYRHCTTISPMSPIHTLEKSGIL